MYYIPTVPCGHQEWFNSYYSMDFILLHKLLDNSSYRQYYENKSLSRVVEGRHSQYWILDNSAFELGESVSSEVLVEWMLRLGVDEVVLPDCYESKEATIKKSSDFISKYGDLLFEKNITMQAVPQGKDSEELIDCLSFFEENLPSSGVLGINKLWRVNRILNIRDYTYRPLHKLGVKDFKEWMTLPSLIDGHLSDSLFRSCDSRILTKIVTGQEDCWEVWLRDNERRILKTLIDSFI